MTEAASRSPGPGSGPGGVPAAIALTPILSARYRARDLDAIRAAAPGARIVTIGFDGHPDGPLDDVEVMLRGRFPAELFDRILARAPSPALGPLRHGGRRAGADAGRRGPATSRSRTPAASSRARSPST